MVPKKTKILSENQGLGARGQGLGLIVGAPLVGALMSFSPAGAGSYNYCLIFILGCARRAGNGGLSENPG